MKELIVICFILSCLWACNRNPTPENFVSFELDGVLWESSNVSTRVLDLGSLFEVEILASNQKSERIRLRIYSLSGKGAGTYFSDNLGTILEYAADGNFSGLNTHRTGISCSGNITITEYEPGLLQGNFNGTLCTNSGNQKIIRNGILNRLRFF